LQQHWIIQQMAAGDAVCLDKAEIATAVVSLFPRVRLRGAICRTHSEDNSVILARVISRLLHFFELFPVTDDVAKFFEQAQPAMNDIDLCFGIIVTRHTVTFTGKPE
jgi:hypothetical protein